MTEMPISEARERIGELVGRARYGGEETVLTYYGAPAAVVISFEKYQQLRHASQAEQAEAGDTPADYRLPPEILEQVQRSREHPEQDVPYRSRRQPAP